MSIFHKAAIATAYVLDVLTIPAPACLNSVSTHAEADAKIETVVKDINSCTKGEVKATRGDSGITSRWAVLDQNWIEAVVNIPGLQNIDDARVSAFTKRLENLTGLEFVDRKRNSLSFKSGSSITRHFDGESIREEIKAVEGNLAALDSYTKIAFLFSDNAAAINQEIRGLRENAIAA